MKIPAFVFSIGLSVTSLAGYAQVKGDDDGILLQQARNRDQAAVQTAVNGWWTASLQQQASRIAWWREARFGCFIHWGVYSVPGGAWKGKKVEGYAEHLMRKEKISRGEYAEKLIQPFHPAHFDATAWVQLIKAAGMKYLIITAKHHDGVAMYPTAIGDYSIRQSGFKTDPMAALSAACKKAGIRFGFYYSHAFDWEHPDAPGNDWDYDNPGGDKLLHGGVNWYDIHPERLPKAVKYVNEKAIPQIQELLRKYHPDILWFDTPSKLPLSENLRILQAIREVDQQVVVNGRLARSAAISFGDYKNTADRPAAFYPVTGDWEAIPTTNESYGYSQYDSSHKPAAFFIRLLAKAAARGGNLLMNIGPEGDGSIDPRDTVILHRIGTWMQRYGASIYGTTTTPLPLQPWGESTRKGNTLYLHVFDWRKTLYVGGLMGDIQKAYLAGSRQQLPFRRAGKKDMILELPAVAPDSMNSVIVLEMKTLQTDTVRVLDTKDITNVLHAFDGTLHGNGWQYGDGKSPTAYVHNWQSPAQYISWKIRTVKDATFRAGIRYLTDAPVASSYVVQIGQQVIKANTVPATGKPAPVTAALQEIFLPAGEYEVTIKADQLQGKELMKLYELTLQPK
ncbi:alpha-L-fucosidase [Chitinophaga nivalis]|uniref:alpha-L-fucosidase n=1 Tax=Chitinophaga nivalis TaxID=2991709 RepID=A0ABT3IEG5_9BACT|nr:alpha-L-fucosidase [Chitinophaga nivalis]MCW3467965.1 alpha-L-fucosidase [Chitinophaga nivalis]MCW3482344.1 alpha-L-fucosidase [Chitinophaga nivalis]